MNVKNIILLYTEAYMCATGVEGILCDPGEAAGK